jgi:hypothetical protein
MERLTARVRVGDDLLYTESAGLPSFNSDEPYRIRVTIPGGFEYTGPDESAETARATLLKTHGAIIYEHTDTHSSLAYVRHGN